MSEEHPSDDAADARAGSHRPGVPARDGRTGGAPGVDDGAGAHGHEPERGPEGAASVEAVDDEVAAFLAAVRDEFLEALPHTVDELSFACARAAEGREDARQTAVHLAHRLAGGAGTFGLGALTDAARALERALGGAGATGAGAEGRSATREDARAPGSEAPAGRRTAVAAALAELQRVALASLARRGTEVAGEPGDSGFARAIRSSSRAPARTAGAGRPLEPQTGPTARDAEASADAAGAAGAHVSVLPVGPGGATTAALRARMTPPPSSQPARAVSQRVGVVVRDPAVRAHVDGALRQFGFEVTVCAAAPEATAALEATAAPEPAAPPGPTARPEPSVWVVDVAAAAALRADHRDAVLIGVLGEPTFEGRLAAVRAGCRAAVAADADAAEIASAIERVAPAETDAPRVLVVDDDALLARTAALALTGAGFEAIVLEDPTLVLDRVAEARPDLVLLDMRLPGCTGLEIASILRSDDRMVGVPIVFLTAEAERDLALEALEAGADDYLTKPFAPEHLVGVVRSRLARSRVMRSFMDRDGLTRLLSHARTLDRLEAEVSLARRRGTPLSLVICDVDHFKKVNDTYGHAAGDRVLRALATLLRRRARKGDVVGRCGGEEFAIVLPGARGADGARVADDRRRTFGQLLHATSGASIRATFSAGVAELGPGMSAAELWDRADGALYEAKRAGRDRVVLAAAEGGAPAGGDDRGGDDRGGETSS